MLVETFEEADEVVTIVINAITNSAGGGLGSKDREKRREGSLEETEGATVVASISLSRASSAWLKLRTIRCDVILQDGRKHHRCVRATITG
jgi:hypothetical protein